MNRPVAQTSGCPAARVFRRVQSQRRSAFRVNFHEEVRKFRSVLATTFSPGADSEVTEALATKFGNRNDNRIIEVEELHGERNFVGIVDEAGNAQMRIRR